MNFDGKFFLSTFIKMEEEVEKYYANFAENVPDEKSKALFTRLSQEEKKHSEMYNSLMKKFGGEMNSEFSDEEVEYTNSLIEENLKGIHDFNTKLGLKDSLEIAERMEKDGILFVHQMMLMYPDIAKKEMETVLKEEKKHLQLVRERMNFAPLRSLGL